MAEENHSKATRPRKPLPRGVIVVTAAKPVRNYIAAIDRAIGDQLLAETPLEKIEIRVMHDAGMQLELIERLFTTEYKGYHHPFLVFHIRVVGSRRRDEPNVI